MDLPPMDPCRVNSKGRHDLLMIEPLDHHTDLTMFCGWCGAVRRLPVNGSPLASRLDDLDADEIERRTRTQE
jgi:hypothetical protein